MFFPCHKLLKGKKISKTIFIFILIKKSSSLTREYLSSCWFFYIRIQIEITFKILLPSQTLRQSKVCKLISIKSKSYQLLSKPNNIILNTIDYLLICLLFRFHNRAKTFIDSNLIYEFFSIAGYLVRMANKTVFFLTF